MPKARQRYLLAKFTSMKNLKVFLDVAENARQQVRPLQHQLLTHIESHITIRDGVLVKGLKSCKLIISSKLNHFLIYLTFANEYEKFEYAFS